MIARTWWKTLAHCASSVSASLPVAGSVPVMMPVISMLPSAASGRNRILVREALDLDAFALGHDHSFAKSIGLVRSSVAVTFGIGYFSPVAQLNSTARSVFFTRPSASAAL